MRIGIDVGGTNTDAVLMDERRVLAGHGCGGRESSPLGPDELRRFAAEIGKREIRSVAVSSVFSPVNSEFEQRAAEIVAEELPGTMISLSHEIGRIGLLEREN